jgi:hypothetical protein
VFQDTISAFVWIDEQKHRTCAVRIAGSSVEIRTGYVTNTAASACLVTLFGRFLTAIPRPTILTVLLPGNYIRAFQMTSEAAFFQKNVYCILTTECIDSLGNSDSRCWTLSQQRAITGTCVLLQHASGSECVIITNG